MKNIYFNLTIKLLILCLLFAYFMSFCQGCGGSGGGGGGTFIYTPSPVTPQSSQIRFYIYFPASSVRSKLDKTSFIKFDITGNGINNTYTQTFEYTSEPMEILLPPGYKKIKVGAYEDEELSNLLFHRVLIINIAPSAIIECPLELGASATDTGFAPMVVSIEENTTLTWTNGGEKPFSLKGDPPFDNQIIKPGENLALTFSKAGTYNYENGFDSSVKGTVIVTEVQNPDIPQPPKIYFIDPNDGANVNDLITIYGEEFGSNISSIKINNINFTDFTLWSTNRITCKIPEGSTTGNIIITTGQMESSPYNYTIFGDTEIIVSGYGGH